MAHRDGRDLNVWVHDPRESVFLMCKRALGVQSIIIDRGIIIDVHGLVGEGLLTSADIYRVTTSLGLHPSLKHFFDAFDEKYKEYTQIIITEMTKSWAYPLVDNSENVAAAKKVLQSFLDESLRILMQQHKQMALRLAQTYDLFPRFAEIKAEEVSQSDISIVESMVDVTDE